MCMDSAAAKNALVGWARKISGAITKATTPLPSVAAAVAGVADDTTRTKRELMAQNALLRQQPQVLHIVQPDTLLRWHRRLCKLVWRRSSKPKGQPARTPEETIELIWKMATENRWGAERIRGELLKLGIRVSKRTIQMYIRRVRSPGGPRGQTWMTFLKNHADDIWACDFLQLYDLAFRPIFAFFIVKYGSQEVVHFNVTWAPTDAWVAQQLREATPDGEGPRSNSRSPDRSRLRWQT